MKYIKYFIYPFFLAGIVLFFAAHFLQTPREAPSEPLKRYLVIVPTDAIEQNQFLQEGIAAAAGERNVYVKFLEAVSFQDQKTEVDKALYSGYDGIILCPMDNGSEGHKMLHTIRENQIELVTILNDISSAYPCLASAQYIGSQTAANLLSQNQTPENIYVLTGNSQNIVYQNRAAAFVSYLEEAGISVTDTLSLNIDIISSADQVKKYISKNNIQYLFCTDAASTASAAKCLNSSLREPPALYGCDYLHTTETYFDTASISSLMCTDYYNTGFYSVLLLDDLVSGTEDTYETYQPSCIATYDASNPFVSPEATAGHDE